MNIFFLDRNPYVAAKYHCDKHVIKMILESSQLLSTAHRFLDGTKVEVEIKGRILKRWIHPDPILDAVLYQATHINHPCCLWVRQSAANYEWLWILAQELNKEFVRRYGKQVNHASIDLLKKALDKYPKNLPDLGLLEPPQCMPPEFQADDFVQGYRNYYVGAKLDIATWTDTPIPQWFLRYKMK